MQPNHLPVNSRKAQNGHGLMLLPKEFISGLVAAIHAICALHP